MGWYKVHKLFRNGQYPSKGSPAEYIEVPKGTRQDDVKSYAGSWADRTPGGQNYGYTVYWSRVSRPSQTWLKKQRDEAISRMKDEENYIKRLELRIVE